MTIRRVLVVLSIVVVVAAALAARQRRESTRQKAWTGAAAPVDQVYEASLDSFPASDPPAWIPTRT